MEINKMKNNEEKKEIAKLISEVKYKINEALDMYEDAKNLGGQDDQMDSIKRIIKEGLLE